MNTKNHLLTLTGVIFVLTQLMISCSTTDNVVSSSIIQKRKYNNGYYVNSFSKKIKISNPKINSDNEINANTLTYLANQEKFENKEIEQKEDNSDYLFASIGEDPIIVSKDNNLDLVKKHKIKNSKYIVSKDTLEECDEIILKKGDIISAKVLEVGVNELKYKKCNNLLGPTYSILKSEVFMIRYTNGNKDFFNKKSSVNSNNSVSNNASDRQTEPFSIVSISSGVFGLFIGLVLSALAGTLFGISGIVFGAISLGKIKKNPDKYKGKGLATAGLVTGIIITALTLLLLL